MLIAHLSDLHLRNPDDAIWLDRQLDRIAAGRPDHLAITGDLLDRWAPALLTRVLDMLAAHDFLCAERARPSCTAITTSHRAVVTHARAPTSGASGCGSGIRRH